MDPNLWIWWEKFLGEPVDRSGFRAVCWTCSTPTDCCVLDELDGLLMAASQPYTNSCRSSTTPIALRKNWTSCFWRHLSYSMLNRSTIQWLWSHRVNINLVNLKTRRISRLKKSHVYQRWCYKHCMSGLKAFGVNELLTGWSSRWVLKITGSDWTVISPRWALLCNNCVTQWKLLAIVKAIKYFHTTVGGYFLSVQTSHRGWGSNQKVERPI